MRMAGEEQRIQPFSVQFQRVATPARQRFAEKYPHPAPPARPSPQGGGTLPLSCHP
jgi:hypothetical protein